ncbi:MAG: phosphoribosylformylglycinamidine cyclo-ligase [Firmicutes bacterium]|nr:phosphoribosylformylglycinamidine cyclo-ligase [Bacillota bacterium]
MAKETTYQSAGVNIQAGYEVVRRIKKLVAPVQPSAVLEGIGAFGGLYELPHGYQEPVLVSGCDGVGTKILIARRWDKLETIGVDLVAMSVNDIAAMGAKPLFFLDYLAVGKLEPDEAERLLVGVVEGCKQADCALLGGETAEMPGVYDPGEFDLAGFAVGIVEKSKIIAGAGIAPGDVLLGLPSSGLHSNGYSLARKICFELNDWTLDWIPPGFTEPLGELLLEPTKIYVKAIQGVLQEVEVKGIAHITGGGLPENVARIIPQGLTAVIETGKWPVPPVFDLLKEAGRVSKEEMYSAFNMGIGLVLVISPEAACLAQKALSAAGETAYVIGSVVSGEGGVRLV